jgi:signal transduction histidine kinase
MVKSAAPGPALSEGHHDGTPRSPLWELEAVVARTAAACHEINGPLTAALATLDLLLAADLPPVAMRELQKCQEQLLRISHIVTRLDLAIDQTAPAGQD